MYNGERMTYNFNGLLNKLYEDINNDDDDGVRSIFSVISADANDDEPRRRRRGQNTSIIGSQLMSFQLSDDDFAKYSSTYLPKSADEFLPVIEQLTVISSSIEAFFAVCRYCIAHARNLAIMSYDQRSSSIENYAKRVKDLLSMKRGQTEEFVNFLEASNSGFSHAVLPSARFRGGYDAAFSTSSGFQIHFKENVQNYISNYVNVQDNESYKRNYLEAYSTELSLGVVRAAAEVLDMLVSGDAKDTKKAHARLSKTVPMDYNFESLNSIFQKHTGFVIPDLFENVSRKLISNYASMFSFNIVRKPNAVICGEIVRTAKAALSSSTTELAPNGQVVPVNADSIAENRIMREPFLVAPDISVSFTLHIPALYASFIAQAAPGEQVSVSSLFQWVAKWSARYVRKKHSRGGISQAEMPTFVLPITKALKTTELRKKNGFYVEPGKGNEDGICISPKGSLIYIPPASERSTLDSQAIAYEEALNDYLSFCFEHGLPPNCTVTASESSEVPSITEGRSSLLSSELKEKVQKLQSFAGKALTYDWDYGATFIVSNTNPTSVRTNSLVGAARLDPITMADYLGYNFSENSTPIQKNAADSIALALNLLTAEQARKGTRAVHVIGGGSNNTLNLFTQESQLGTRFINACLYFIIKGYAPEVLTYISEAAKDLGVTFTQDDPKNSWIFTTATVPGVSLYNQPISAEGINALYKRDSFKAVADVGHFFASAINFCKGNNAAFRRMVAQEAEQQGQSGLGVMEISALSEEHPMRFDFETDPISKLGAVYKTLGGLIFLKMIKAMLAIPKKDMFSSDDTVPYRNQFDNLDHLAKPTFEFLSTFFIPVCTMLAKYVPNADNLLAQAEEYIEATRPDSSLTVDDIKLAGSEKGAQFFPHQVKAHGALRKRPAFAVLDISPGGGKCAHFKHLAVSENGLLKVGEVYELADAETTVADRDGIGHWRDINTRVISHERKKAKADRAYKRRGVTTIARFSLGEEIEGLADHKLWAFNPETGTEDFYRLDELTNKMWCRKAIGTSLFAKKRTKFGRLSVDEDVAELLGWIVSEGHVHSNKTITISQKEGEMNDRIRALITEALDENSIGNNADRACIAIVGEYRNDLFDLFGHTTSATVEVPLCIRASNKEIQIAFLQSLFEGDGSIYVKGTNRWVIEYCTISNELANQVKAMLENIGIPAQLQRGEVYRSNNHEHDKQKNRLFIPITYIPKFAQTIGFLSEEKCARLQDAVAHIKWLGTNAKQATNMLACGFDNWIPAQELVEDTLNAISTFVSGYSYDVAFGDQTRTCYYSLSKIARDAGIGEKVMEATGKDGVVSKYKVMSVIRLYEALPRHIKRDMDTQTRIAGKIAKLQDMLDSVWTRFVENAEGTEQDLYDISVPGPHSYVIEGMYGHNTSIGCTDIFALVQEMNDLGSERIRPIILCPDSLIKNWVNDAKIFVKHNWNMLPLNTKILDRWGYDKLEELIANAPINTVVVAGFNFLNGRKENITIGTHSVKIPNNLEFIKRFGFNYVIIDEVHKLKNLTSQRHAVMKQLTTSSFVKYLRIATGTLIHNRVSDVVGQTALYNAHIFRSGEVSDSSLSGDIDESWAVSSPKRAREKLKNYAATITQKRKEWAFMLPNPIETFHAVSMIPDSTDAKDLELGELHQSLYDTVLKLTVEELEKLLDKAKSKRGSGEDDDSEGEESSEVGDLGIEASEESANSEELAAISPSQLSVYLARIERLIINPMEDPLAPDIFGAAGVQTYHSAKARYIAKLLHQHFNPRKWNQGEIYNEMTLLDYEGKLYLARKLNKDTHKNVTLPDTTIGIAPPNNPDVWKEEPQGKVIIFCRYTNSVKGVYKALPDVYKNQALMFTGDEDNKWANLERFLNDPKIQILVANEQGLSEGHNMQIASRLIRCEAPWTPGELDQTSSRVFRPDPAAAAAMVKSGKPGELYREAIFLDWVLCDNSMEVAKQGRLIAKILERARFDEAENPRYKDVLSRHDLEEISMSLDLLRENPSLESIQQYVNAYADLNGVERAEFHDMRVNQDPTMQSITPSPVLPGFAKIGGPFVSDQNPDDVDNIGLQSLTKLFRNHPEYVVTPEKLEGKPVVTEFGKGIIESIRVRYKRRPVTDEKGNVVRGAGGKMLSERVLDAAGNPIIDENDPIVSMKIKLAGKAITDPDAFLSVNDSGIIFVPTKPVSADLMKTFTEGAVGKSKPPKVDKAPKDKNIVDLEKRREEERRKEREREEEKRIKAEERRRKKEKAEAEALIKAADDAKKRKKNIKDGKPINAGIHIGEVPPVKPVNGDKNGKTKEVKEVIEIDLVPAYYHGYLVLEAPFEQAKYLSKLGFTESGPYVYTEADRYSRFSKILDYLEDNFELSRQSIKRLTEIQDAFERGGKEVYKMELAAISSMPYFFATRKKRVENAKEIRPYPIILPEYLQIAVDLNTNPAIRKHVGRSIPGAVTKWKISEGNALFFAHTKADLSSKLRDIEDAGFKIKDKATVLAEIRNIKFRSKQK